MLCERGAADGAAGCCCWLPLVNGVGAADRRPPPDKETAMLAIYTYNDQGQLLALCWLKH